MADLPRLSVVVPVYNAADLLPRTVPAMLAQDVPADWTFVDDGSTDGSAVLLEGLIASTAPSAPAATARVVRHPGNRGRAAARNTGLTHASGDVVVFLDADMEPAPDFLRAHARMHTRPGVVGAVSPEAWADLDPADPYHLYLARFRRGLHGHPAGRPLHPRLFIIGYTSVRRAALGAVGGFDEAIPYGEDTDLAMRLAARFPDGLRAAEGARVVQHGAPRLDDALTKWARFGRMSVPLLLARHPQLAPALGADLAHPTSARGLLGTLVLRPVLAALVRRALPAIPASLRPFAVRYLVASAVVGGYRASTRATSSPRPVPA